MFLKGPIARSTLRTSAVLGLRLVVQAGTLLLVARLLGPGDYGAFAGVAGLAVTLGTLSTFGFHLLLLDRVSRNPNTRARAMAHAVPATLLCGTVLLVVFLLVCATVLRSLAIGLPALLAIGITELLLQPLFALPAWTLTALGKTARSQLLAIHIPACWYRPKSSSWFAIPPSRPTPKVTPPCIVIWWSSATACWASTCAWPASPMWLDTASDCTHSRASRKACWNVWTRTIATRWCSRHGSSERRHPAHPPPVADALQGVT